MNLRLFEPHAGVVAIPLPDSINAITDKRHELPIVTTVDFLPARDGTGPSWHAYHRANKDLKLVCALYEVAFGILVFRKGPRIGVPPRPSSVRVLTEALLRDGYGILDEVELVDLRPDEVTPDRVDATALHLLSFKQGLAAWDGTEDSVVTSLLQRLPEATLDWPALSSNHRHRAAVDRVLGAVDRGRPVRHEERHELGDLLGPGRPADRNSAK